MVRPRIVVASSPWAGVEQPAVVASASSGFILVFKEFRVIVFGFHRKISDLFPLASWLSPKVSGLGSHT